MFCFYLRRKPKAKAPRPPAETRYVDASSVDPVESSACIMEQKENTIDKDIELSVVLPGDIIKSTTVHGRYNAVNERAGVPFLLLSLIPSVIYVLLDFFFDKILHSSLRYLFNMLKGDNLFLIIF